MRLFRHRPVTGAVLAVLVLTGCAAVIDGTGTPGTRAATAPTDFPSAPSTPSTPATPETPSTPETPTASSTGSSTSAADLVKLLAPGPAGSESWGTAWSRNVSPTIAQFVAHVYPPTAARIATAQLTAQGLNAVAHRTWTATNSNQADEILLRFDTDTGAVSRYRAATAAKAAGAGQVPFQIPGFAQAIGYSSPKIDDLGDVRTIVYGRVGGIVMEIFYYSPAKLDKAGAIAAATAQLRLLPG